MFLYWLVLSVYLFFPCLQNDTTKYSNRFHVRQMYDDAENKMDCIPLAKIADPHLN